ncbi:MAG: carbohydrate porin [Povalibacter sp.]
MRSLAIALCALFTLPDHAWGATCADCAPHALEIEAVYTGELWRNASGGIDTGNRYLDNLDLTFDADGAQLFGVDGLEIFGYLLYNNGHSIDELSNAAQGISNIESTRALRLYELWTEWKFGAQDHSVRFGLYDLNSEFDSIEAAGLFINPSHGIGPDFSQSGENGPSIFPVTSLGLRARANTGAWTFQAAVLDAVPGDPDHPDRTGMHLSSNEGALLVGEMNYRVASGVRIGTGYWRYTSDFSAIETTGSTELTRSGNAGAYVLAESPLLLSNENDRGMRVFARTGFAEDRINPIHRYYGAGAVYTGLTAQRPEDQLGFAIAVAKLGAPYIEVQQSNGFSATRYEYDFELTYRLDVNEWLTLQSDVQYMRNPGMDPSLKSAWALGLRFELGRGWSW